ncbi:uncharacterized protein E5676_scaffold775G00820 [Cucumis melo var. makuwa]|uniref:Uncharacterized protein n=1 Tax=Cucumis melo var. makuwa TaxID=1194695 RepID=A0A5D3BSH6_CUCMM|nr:uncharacterized protein E6C27_scaffold744G00170 [Cucumis melo var. makuwa]TYK01752.1 uncharacterized protein E5676_scaffold775G00820 [Cucumis melo var. makuwa]
MLFQGKCEIRRTSKSHIENEVEDSEKDEKDNDGRNRDVVYASSSMPSPQKNTLIPTSRSSFNNNRYQSSSITSDITIEEEEKIESGGDSTLNPKVRLRREGRKA